jgi:methylthioribulose-1-phosphate dehydratase
MQLEDAAARLATIGREFHSRGWALGTSGNFSAVTSRDPLTLAITASGVDKSRLAADHVIEIDCDGHTPAGPLVPSSEAVVHVSIVAATNAGAVLHTHSVWSTILSEAFAMAGSGLDIEGYEMLKGLAGVHTHQHREWLPILENTQHWAAESDRIQNMLREFPLLHAFLIRGHGLYTWGTDLDEARRHVEILEFLLEVRGRLYCAARP